MKTGIIFDLDGTLWDATEQMLPAWNQVLARYSNRNPMTLAEVRSYMGKTVEEIAAAALPSLPEEMRVAVFNQCCIEELPWLQEHPGTIYPDVPQVLHQLAEQYPLYIVSNCQDGYIQTFLEVSGLGDCFTDFTCSGMTGRGKGSNIRLMVEKHQLDKAVYLGDTQGDYQACQKAQVPFIHAAYGMGTVDQPVKRILSFSELPAVLSEIL
jgi:phosphoglycolate phosphatase